VGAPVSPFKDGVTYREGRVKMSWIKVCGVSREEDIEAVASAGGNAIGLLHLKHGQVHEPGSDRLPVEEIARLSELATFRALESVLLIHVSTQEFVEFICERVRPTAIQLQVDVPQKLIEALKQRMPKIICIKTIRNRTSVELLLQEVEEAMGSPIVDRILLDAARPGSGDRNDWQVCKQLAASAAGKPVIIAGGLNANNVREAISLVRPFGVDVMSGVRGGGRRIDPERVKEFVLAARVGFG
jgi:phosphoribosylanthranilate isomerase